MDFVQAADVQAVNVGIAGLEGFANKYTRVGISFHFSGDKVLKDIYATTVTENRVLMVQISVIITE